MAVDYRAIARANALKYGIDPDVFVRQIQQESGFRPDAGSPAGAQGIAQIMPATAKGWGVDPHDPVASLDAAAKAMAKYLKSYKGDYAKSLAAYNAGVGAVAKYGGVPPYAETKNYIKTILGGKTPASKPPNAAQGATGAPDAVSDSRTAALEFIMKGSPFEGMAAARYEPTRPSARATTPTAANATGGTAPGQRKGEPGWKYLQRLGQSRFGLKNDPGTSQLYGGRHSAGSEHGWDSANPEADGRAVDFGTARNTKAQLQAWMKWARAQGFDAIDEGDHIHTSMPGGGI